MKLDKLLAKYVYNTTDPKRNFQIGCEYEKIGQIASAVSYYLKCIDVSHPEENTILQYECLLRIGICFETLGDRNTTVTDVYKRAIAMNPVRPEAYFLLSRFYEVHQYSGHWTDAYQIATIGDVASSMHRYYPLESLKTDVGYPGDYALTFQRALSAWWIGKYNLSRELLIRIEEWPGDIRQEYRGTATFNLDQVGRQSE